MPKTSLPQFVPVWQASALLDSARVEKNETAQSTMEQFVREVLQTPQQPSMGNEVSFDGAEYR